MTDSPIERLLSRLEGVRQIGPGRWIARCPAHDDETPSLSVRELADRRILLKDFGADCGAAEVMRAVDLSLAHLFPERLTEHARPTQSRVAVSDLIPVLDREGLVLAIIGQEMIDNRTVAPEVLDRIAQAVHRIGRIRDYLTPARVKKH